MALCSRQKSSPTSCPRAAPRSFERRACFVGRRCRSARRPSRCCCRPAPSRPSSRRPGSPGRAAPAGSSSPSRVRVPCTELERGIPARYHVQSACVHASCNVPVFTVDRGTKASVIHEGPTQHFITIGSHSLSRTHISRCPLSARTSWNIQDECAEPIRRHQRSAASWSGSSSRFIAPTIRRGRSCRLRFDAALPEQGATEAVLLLADGVEWPTQHQVHLHQLRMLEARAGPQESARPSGGRVRTRSDGSAELAPAKRTALRQPRPPLSYCP